jgi:hypothetical protein
VSDYGRADPESTVTPDPTAIPDSTAIPVYGSAPMRPAESAPPGDAPESDLPPTEPPNPAVDVVAALAGVSTQLGELLRLRARDVDLADRLYAENTRLRTGEFAAAVAPLMTGLIRLHDQMTSLAGGDSSSVAGMLRIQLLQILDTAAGLSPFEPRLGDRFDSSRQAGVGRARTADPAAEGTVARNIKPGFERADGSVVRVAQVEVYRFESPQQ